MVAEARVGILFLIAILLAVTTVIYLTGRWGWMSGQHLMVHYRDVEGLTEGAQVLFLGMEIGRVLEIRLAKDDELKEFPEKPIVVLLAIKRDVQLLDTDEFVITQSGMLGDRHIAVRRKTEEERKAEAKLLGEPLKRPLPLVDDAHAAGQKAVGIAELGDQADVVLKQVELAIADLKAVYASPEIQRQLPLILTNVERATTHAVEFSQALARISLQNEAHISRIARDIASAAGELNKSAQRVRQLVMTSAPNIEGATARVARMIEASATNIEATSSHLKRTGARVEKLVDTSAEDIEASTQIARATLSRTSENLERAAEHVERTTSSVEETTRAAGADLAATARRVRELIEGSSDNIERAAEEVEKATTSMAALVERSGKDIGESTKRINEMVQNSAGNIETASANLAKMSETMHADLAAVSGQARTMVEKSSADIERTTSRIAKLSERSADDIERTTRRIHDLLATSPLPNDLAATGAHIRRAASNIEELTEHFKSTLGDPEITANIKVASSNLEKASGHIAAMAAASEALVTDEEMWANIRQTVSKLNAAMDDLADITAHGKSVLTDPELTEDFTQSVRNVRELTEHGVEVAKKADESLARVDQTMDKVQGVYRNLAPTLTTGYASLEGVEDFGLRGDVVLDFYFGETPEDYWRLGVRDLGDAETLILQRGFAFDSGGALRLGVLGNKFGVGLDYPFGRRLSVELDAWNQNDPRLDVRGTLGLGRDWRLLFGATEVLSGTDPFIGLRRDFGFGRPEPKKPEAMGADSQAVAPAEAPTGERN